MRLCGKNKDFMVKVRVHQDSAFSSYLFFPVLDEIKKEIQGEISWYMRFVDNIVLVGKSFEKVNGRQKSGKQLSRGNV